MTKAANVFSPSEVDLLKHRLGIPDCLCDVLADNPDDDIAQLAVADSGEAVWKSCDKLTALIERKIPIAVIMSDLSVLDRTVLIEVIEGSTWVANASEEPAIIRAGFIKTANSVVRKLRAAGLPVGDVPIF